MAVSDYISNGGFGMGSYGRARGAGYSDKDIYNFLASWGGTIGDAVRNNMATFNSQQAQEQQGLGLQSYNRALASGQTPQQFFDYAKGSGLTIGGGLQAEMDKFNSSQVRPMKINEAKNLNQGLKIAGRVLSNNEIKRLTKATGKSAERVIQRAVGKGVTLGSNVVNKYQKGKYTDPMLAMARTALPAFAMAAGKDSNILKQIREAGRLDKGSSLFIGSKGSTATVLPRNLETGKGGNKPMVGGDYSYTPEEAAPTTTNPVNTYTEPTIPEATSESKFGPGGPGAALDGSATGLRGRRSRWRTAGKTTKGTSNLKIKGQTGRSSGVNLAIS